MSLSALPFDLLVDHLLPSLSLTGLLALTCTSKDFATTCSDPILWKRKLETDFNYYPSAETARTSGFKLIYKGIHRPKVFIWGHLGHGRRGVEGAELPRGEAFPYPVEVKFKRRIVSLTSGGWSYHALDDTGNIHVWGTLNGTVMFQSPPEDPWFAESGSRATAPIRLDLPTRFISTSCGRTHSAALDIEHRVWLFTRWGRPNLLAFTGTLDKPIQRHPRIENTQIIQVDCGFDPSVVFLTADGRAFIIWASSGSFLHQETIANAALDANDDGSPVKAIDGVVKCIPVLIRAEPLMLPPLPSDLPHLQAGVVTEGHPNSPPKLIKIAAGNPYIVGLTDQGHVLYMVVRGGDAADGLETLREEFNGGIRRWIYLPQFSEVNEIVKDPVYTTEDGVSQVSPPKTLNITHISSHLESFVVYSTGASSVVLVATLAARDGVHIRFHRMIHPTLQGREIVSVSPSESHFAALDADGTMLTWGIDHRGCLGQGELGRSNGQWWRSIPVDQPAKVRFDRNFLGRRMFCYSMTAGGWHTGALVFDLDDDPKAEEVEELPSTETQVAKQEEPSPSDLVVSAKSRSLTMDQPQRSSSSKGSKWKRWKSIFKRKTV
ncbi:hypothetical protein FRC02_001984 [Tulasnella sp. 418]|nr:hypothetical protein FRC02_001984 [Tulasnella sp. 418]